MDYSDYKFVAVANKKIEPGKIMNAIAHASLGITQKLSAEELEATQFIDFVDQSGESHDNISGRSYVILRADNSNQIRTFRENIKQLGIKYVDFLETMTGDTYKEQIEKTAATAADQLEYYVVVCFGKKEDIDPLTKKFSLWR